MKLKQILKKLTIPSLLLSFPFVAKGFSLSDSGNNFKTIVEYIVNLINLLIPVLFGSAFIVFFWGLSKFILNSGSSAEVTKGKNYMFWGILALFVLVSIKSIVGLIATNLEIGNNSFIIPLLRTN